MNRPCVTEVDAAALFGNLDSVKYLVAKGADVNAMNKDGITPLRVATEFGKLEVAEFLKQHGAKE